MLLTERKNDAKHNTAVAYATRRQWQLQIMSTILGQVKDCDTRIDENATSTESQIYHIPQ